MNHPLLQLTLANMLAYQQRIFYLKNKNKTKQTTKQNQNLGAILEVILDSWSLFGENPLRQGIFAKNLILSKYSIWAKSYDNNIRKSRIWT